MKKHIKSQQSKHAILDLSHVTVAKNAKELGVQLAVTFLCWIAKNPEGVISLPTGKTPQMFIQALGWMKYNWHTAQVQELFAGTCLEQMAYPDTTRLYFVQMDEFYFKTVDQNNLYVTYIRNHYQKVLGFSDERFLNFDYAHIFAWAGLFEGQTIDEIMDLTDADKDGPSSAAAVSAKKAIDKYLVWYEQRIKEVGGIGFFVGGIGPDGHIAYNMPGASSESVTRAVVLNYKSAAAVASLYGGYSQITVPVVITIGLKTLRYNKNAQIYIIASGVSKAEVIFQAVCAAKSSTEIPASLLPQHNLHYVLTQGAASLLPGYARVSQISNQLIVEKIAHGAAKIEDKVIVHTSPHHDDEMLGYLPYIHRLLAHNKNYFYYITSGSNSVGDRHMIQMLYFIKNNVEQISHSLAGKKLKDIVEESLRYLVSSEADAPRYVHAFLLAYVVSEVYSEYENLDVQVTYVLDVYYSKKASGACDDEPMKRCKARLREVEAEVMLELFDVPQSHISHARALFYNNSQWLSDAVLGQDVQVMYDYLCKVKPDIITVALDPEGSGPDTHYKSLLVVAQALRKYDADIQVWGYRNVWDSFKLDEVTDILLVDKEEMRTMKLLFKNCFVTQYNPECPSVHYYGPFSELAEKIQYKQLQEVKKYVPSSSLQHYMHTDAFGVVVDVSQLAGAIYLKKMSKEEFLALAPTVDEFKF